MHCIGALHLHAISASHLGVELLGRDREPRVDQPKPLVPHAHLGGARRDLALQQAEAGLSPLAAQLGRTQLLERGGGVGIALGEAQLQQRHALTLRGELTQQALGSGRGVLLLLLQQA